jgi:tetratricopeptide (TPR) repeat protein
MGRICCKTGRYEEALEYFLSELKTTKSTLGKYNIEVSRILHDVAKIYEDSLGDYEKALKYYKKAFKVERRAAKLTPQLSAQVLETQRCMGRIHYKRGEFDKAFTVSFADDLSASTM